MTAPPAPIPMLDTAMNDGSPAPHAIPLARKSLHEFYAARHADAASLSGSGLLLAKGDGSGTRLWVRHAGHDREAGIPSPAGLAELGLDPARIVLVNARDAQSALQAGLEGARCTALGAVIIELWGEERGYDLTASRRLALAAKASGVPVFMLRVAATPIPSAAETRWLLRAAPSRALAAQAPGPPAFHLTMLRGRNGQEGLIYHVEWNSHARCLETRLAGPERAGSAEREAGITISGDEIRAAGAPTPLSGLVVPVSFDRPGTQPDAPPRWRRAG